MYNINQLSEMSDEQLRELAKSMGIKRVDSAEHDDLVYQVLDQQAESEAANTPEPTKRRRERIRQPAAKANGNEVTKDDAVATKSNKKKKEKDKVEEMVQPEAIPAEAPAVEVAEQQPVAAEAPKRKRGRPSAAEKAARDAALKAGQPVAEQTPDKRLPARQPIPLLSSSQHASVAARQSSRFRNRYCRLTIWMPLPSPCPTPDRNP